MTNPTRRAFLGAAAMTTAAAGMGGRAAAGFAPKSTDVGIEDVSFEYEDYSYRAPLKFGGIVVEKATILNVRCVVRSRGGETAGGFGSMPLGNVWSFPSRRLSYDQTLAAMKALAGKVRDLTAAHREPGHPIDVNRDLEPDYLKAAADVARDLDLGEPIPKLCALVTASAFDAAVHDAFGKLHGLNCYKTYGPEFMSRDLGEYLGPEFKGEPAGRYVSTRARGKMPLYHLVGAVDPITRDDVEKPIGDGLPETLPEWIDHNGLTHLKIKLNGDDLDWDVARVVKVDRVAAEVQKRRGVADWVYSLDFNERVPNVAYLVDFIARLKADAPEGFRRVRYIEQPTVRDLRAVEPHALDAASKSLPIVIDESLTDYEALLMSRDRGYTGVALKACKGQSHAVLLAAAARKFEMFLCVQDLTCPGASLIHSAGISAHIPGVHAIEANARQYMPEANRAWAERFPGLFHVVDGLMDTSALDGPGLSAVP